MHPINLRNHLLEFKLWIYFSVARNILNCSYLGEVIILSLQKAFPSLPGMKAHLSYPQNTDNFVTDTSFSTASFHRIVKPRNILFKV